MRKFITVTLAVSLIFSGCSATELEDRCFPMMAAVDLRAGSIEFSYGFPELSQRENTDLDESKVDAAIACGEDFKEAYEEYIRQLSKLVDCDHIKILVLGSSLVDSDKFDDTLDYLKSTELFPRNIIVCTADNVRALYETESALPEDLGTYLFSYLTRQAKDQGLKLPDLGDLLDARINDSALPVLPHIEVDDKIISLSHILYKTVCVTE